MKKKIINILIVVSIIVGVAGAWFIKNKDFSKEDETVPNDMEQLIQEDIRVEGVEGGVENIVNEEKKELEDKINEADDVKIENIVNEKESEIVEDSNEVEKEDAQIVIDKNDPNFELSTPSFDVETLTYYGLPILLDFGASWCAPCKRMHPILEELNGELRGKAIIKYVDIDLYPEATKGFNFSLIPTQYFITADGEIYKTHTGILSKDAAIEILKEMGMEE